MSKIHEYLTLERWEDYKEENGIDTGMFLYTIPDYRFERLIAEAEILHEEVEMLQRNINSLLQVISGEYRTYTDAETAIDDLFNEINELKKNQVETEEVKTSNLQKRRPLKDIYTVMEEINNRENDLSDLAYMFNEWHKIKKENDE